MKEKVVLKSTHPEEYPDLVVECRVIPNDQIGAYLASIPEDRKFYAYKSAPVKARKGKVGESIKSTLTTVVNGREYVLFEEENCVNERTYTKKVGEKEKEITASDVVITNYKSTSNEEYVIRHEKFMDTYELIEEDKFMPKYDSRLLTKVDENVIIITLWGSKAVCLAGSYIVTYNASKSDYNVIEEGAFKSTYTRENQPKKVKKM